ncbi:MAG: CRISPR-associated endonuclease Cas1 [Bryobacterales bacterium]|nr:CRISPR-associated endonuclease Cas1 [Bryobacteraceae bacterium]MDW8354305.1 CRISPR-associated endonuclease Cas1 [Bryobacterales bacterium]
MATLYLDRSGLELREDSDCVAVYEGGHKRRSVPLRMLERVVILGNVQLSSRLLARLAARQIGVIVLDRRRGEARTASLWLGGGDARRRLAQYRAYQDENWRRDWSRRLVRRKLASQRAFLLAAAEERPSLRHPLHAAAETLAQLLERLRRPEPLERETIRGWEGAGAAAYFAAYCRLFPPALEFHDRNRRPPQDPVNACLSLAYTLAHYQACCIAAAAGLDPAIGFYHELTHGRESLACDLVEPVRPRIEAWVWRMFRQRRLRAEHFRRYAGACLLGKAGRSIFYEDYELVSADWGRLERRWCRALVGALLGQSVEEGRPDETTLS